MRVILVLILPILSISYVNMGAQINLGGHDVTQDGNYLFYTSNEDIYWVSTEILQKSKNN